MRKILIVTNSLSIGGITTSLKNTIKLMNSMGYKIDVFVFDDSIELNINNVKQIKSNILLKIVSLSGKQAREKGIITYIIRSAFAVLCKIFGANIVYSIIFKFSNSLDNYDIAISFSNNLGDKTLYFGANKFVLEKVNAQKKITWLHIDYDKINIDSKVTRSEYNKFDAIIGVSEATKESFLKYNPNLKDKCKVIYNCLDSSKIKKMSLESCERLVDNAIICVGRLDKNKSQITLVDLANDLKNKHLDFKIYLLGDGPERVNIQNKINELNLSEYIEILGWVSNPYPYIKQAKLTVSTSLTESYGLSIAESLLLNIPVVVLKYPAIIEIIENKVNGIIINNYSELLSEVSNLLLNEEYYNKLKQNTVLNIDEAKVIKQIKEALGEIDEK